MVDDKIKQLELVESQLVLKLSQTQQTQAKALENLNSAIKLCTNQSKPVSKQPVLPSNITVTS
jgi:hypothetical protein